MSSNSSSSFESTIILIVAVALVSFFAGTIFTVNMNMECVGGGGTGTGTGIDYYHMNTKIEELAQKRLLGT